MSPKGIDANPQSTSHAFLHVAIYYVFARCSQTAVSMHGANIIHAFLDVNDAIVGAEQPGDHSRENSGYIVHMYSRHGADSYTVKTQNRK